MQPRASAAWNVRQRAVGLNVRDGTCAVQLHRLQSRLPRHHRNRQFCHSTPRSSAIPDGMRCAAQRFPQAVVRCNTPRSVPLRSAWRGAVLGGNRCNSKRTFDAGRKLQQTTCNRHHAADNIQHEASGGQHTRKANKRRQRAADNMQRKRRGRREAADSVQQTPCGIRHAAHNVQHRRAADNMQQTTCGRQHAAEIMKCITRTRQND